MSRRRHEASQAKGHARGHQPQPITIRLRRESSQSGQKHRLADSPRAGLVSIVEPEVDIHSPRKTEAERQLRTGIRAELDRLDQDQAVILKLTLPEVDDFYQEFVAHPQVVRVLALSGGYTRAQATARLARNHGVIASLSRALTEGLAIDQTDEEFDAVLDEAIESIADASRT